MRLPVFKLIFFICVKRTDYMARLYPLFSGSKGNCYYLTSGGKGILIDAGRSAKQIENAMKDNELDIKDVCGIFITHEHSDHISGLRVLASRYSINVYSSKGTLDYLNNAGILTDKYNSYVIGTAGVETAGMLVKSFRTSHDCCESVGYSVETPDGRKFAIATDTGCLTDEIINSINGCDVVAIESNHDVNMLLNGVYPYPLKRRILSDVGHLSNETCSGILPRLVKSGTTRFVLAHLSRENNMPRIAQQSALCSLQENGMKQNIDFTLDIAKEVTMGESIVF